MIGPLEKQQGKSFDATRQRRKNNQRFQARNNFRWKLYLKERRPPPTPADAGVVFSGSCRRLARREDGRDYRARCASTHKCVWQVERERKLVEKHDADFTSLRAKNHVKL